MSIIVGILVTLIMGSVVGLLSYSKGKTAGYRRGLSNKEEFAKAKVNEQTEKMQWVYEDSTSPRWRYSKVTGETQKRYQKTSSLAKIVLGDTPDYTEWRTIDKQRADKTPAKKIKVQLPASPSRKVSVNTVKSNG